MAEDITFVVHSEWLDNINELPVEQQDRIIAEIVRYGAGLESMHPQDAVTQAFVNFVKGRIDFSKNKYQNKVNAGKAFGKKKKVEEGEILRLAHEGKTSAQIAEILDVSKSLVDHSEEWRNRNNPTIEASLNQSEFTF